jgi:emfourin
MRVRIRRDGGLAHFPGLAEPVTLDIDALPPERRAEFEQALRGARAASSPPAAASARDMVHYVIEVDDGATHQTFRVSDPPADPSLAALVAFARRTAREAADRSRPQ